MSLRRLSSRLSTVAELATKRETASFFRVDRRGAASFSLSVFWGGGGGGGCWAEARGGLSSSAAGALRRFFSAAASRAAGLRSLSLTSLGPGWGLFWARGRFAGGFSSFGAAPPRGAPRWTPW